MKNTVALAAWDEVAQAARLRHIGDGEERLAIIIANQILAILVTGYENLLRKTLHRTDRGGPPSGL